MSFIMVNPIKPFIIIVVAHDSAHRGKYNILVIR